ncbi:hypothetical protein BDV96DRAFT_567218 [Lophiotrema nucula]|uniref:Uncharacterized protein n=1 Tax=Lophiotrema nucula TaxID=690887 RepID=A0A6A5ZJL1_9PLEO|nr:hypothetical protein BDV96DRAFT_567218 [Lophiotrema nucula]
MLYPNYSKISLEVSTNNWGETSTSDDMSPTKLPWPDDEGKSSPEPYMSTPNSPPTTQNSLSTPPAPTHSYTTDIQHPPSVASPGRRRATSAPNTAPSLEAQNTLNSAQSPQERTLPTSPTSPVTPPSPVLLANSMLLAPPRRPPAGEARRMVRVELCVGSTVRTAPSGSSTSGTSTHENLTTIHAQGQQTTPMAKSVPKPPNMNSTPTATPSPLKPSSGGGATVGTPFATREKMVADMQKMTLKYKNSVGDEGWGRASITLRPQFEPQQQEENKVLTQTPNRPVQLETRSLLHIETETPSRTRTGPRRPPLPPSFLDTPAKRPPTAATPAKPSATAPRKLAASTSVMGSPATRPPPAPQTPATKKTGRLQLGTPGINASAQKPLFGTASATAGPSTRLLTDRSSRREESTSIRSSITAPPRRFERPSIFNPRPNDTATTLAPISKKPSSTTQTPRKTTARPFAPQAQDVPESLSSGTAAEPRFASSTDIGRFIGHLNEEDRQRASLTPEGSPSASTPATNKPLNRRTRRHVTGAPSTPANTGARRRTPSSFTPSKEIASSLDSAIDDRINDYARQGRDFTPSGNKVSDLMNARQENDKKQKALKPWKTPSGSSPSIRKGYSIGSTQRTFMKGGSRVYLLLG